MGRGLRWPEDDAALAAAFGCISAKDWRARNSMRTPAAQRRALAQVERARRVAVVQMTQAAADHQQWLAWLERYPNTVQLAEVKHGTAE